MILVSAVDDVNYEDTLESFLVILTIPAGATDVVLGLRANASVTIEDNDGKHYFSIFQCFMFQCIVAV